MNILFNILIALNIFAITFVIIKYILENSKYIKLKLKSNLKTTKFASLLDNKLRYLDIYNGDQKNKKISAITIFSISVLISILTNFLSSISIKIVSTSIILSVVSFFVPYIIISIDVNKKVQKIKSILPSYIVNLKNNLEVTNNIIKAMRITKVEAPLEYSINNFNYKVERGINVYQCFDELKENVNIDVFSSLVDAFKVCYMNGGDFICVLNKYTDIISKENMEKAKLKENSSATILTLIIMVCINILLLFSVVLSNLEYSQIILGTLGGHVIINFEIISYLLVVYFVYKVYKMEE